MAAQSAALLSNHRLLFDISDTVAWGLQGARKLAQVRELIF